MSCLVVAVVGVGRRLLGSVGRLSSSEMPLMHLSFSSALSLSLSLSVSLLFLFSIPTRPPAVMGHWVAGPLDLSANTYHVILRSMGIDGAFIALAA